MSKWSYALTRSTDPNTGEVQYAIREIFYDTNPDAPSLVWTADPVEPVGETVIELLDEIRRFENAATSPRVFDIDTREWVQVPPTKEGA